MSAREKLTELMRLHDEAFEVALAINGVCKRGEGRVTLELTSADERRDGAAPLGITGVEVWAYTIGPSRSHWFDSIDDALEAVRGWHAGIMEQAEALNA